MKTHRLIQRSYVEVRKGITFGRKGVEFALDQGSILGQLLEGPWEISAGRREETHILRHTVFFAFMGRFSGEVLP
jgi:hypothetical protein